MQTTGNAGGVRNLLLQPGKFGFEELLREMGKGFYVTEVMGQGVNLVTGDYSRGAAGFLVVDGEISHAVEEVTIAGNLRDMFLGILAAGKDLDTRGNTHVGSVLIDRMTVAGA
jgi:PmbA protein